MRPYTVKFRQYKKDKVETKVIDALNMLQALQALEEVFPYCDVIYCDNYSYYSLENQLAEIQP